MTDRDKIIETMAQKIYYAAPQTILGGTVHWPELPSNFDYLQRRARAQASAALTAYESHLQASGMAVVQGWQSIESAPKDGTEILVCCPVAWNGRYSGDQIVVAENNGSTNDHGWRLTYTGGYAEDADLDGVPSHWMPLPAPPDTKD